MWLFTKHGFFSVVQDWADSDIVWVRARKKHHLTRLVKAFPSLLPHVQIDSTPKNDYAYRICMRRELFAQVTNALSCDVDYPNFKDACKPDKKYATMLLNVWWTVKNALAARRPWR